jgi:CheY-like chemotaxis protein
MQKTGLDPETRVNLAKASILVIEASQHAADVLGQMLKGFGVGEVHRATTIGEAERVLQTSVVDLIIADPKLRDGDAYDYLREIRQRKDAAYRYVPFILASAHSTRSDVKRARDTGGNFFVAKPIAPGVLLQRILWVAKDKRPYVEVGAYVGPDRRFKFEGPPVGMDGRRDSDLTEPLPDAAAPNMSQSEIDDLIKPQRVVI